MTYSAVMDGAIVYLVVIFPFALMASLVRDCLLAWKVGR